MPPKAKSGIQTISDLVAQSINQKKLHVDYNDILAQCRKANISSYTLHQIIEYELLRAEGDASTQPKHDDLGFETLKVADEPKPQPPVQEPVAPTPDSSGSWVSGFFKVFLVLTLLVGIFVGIGVNSRNEELREQLDNKNAELSSLRRQINEYEGYKFPNWTSTNKSQYSKDEKEIQFQAKKGDVFSAVCNVDCSDYANFTMYITLAGGKATKLTELSGLRNYNVPVSYTIPDDGTYYVKMIYQKKWEKSYGADEANVRDIRLMPKEIIELKEGGGGGRR